MNAMTSGLPTTNYNLTKTKIVIKESILYGNECDEKSMWKQLQKKMLVLGKYKEVQLLMKGSFMPPAFSQYSQAEQVRDHSYVLQLMPVLHGPAGAIMEYSLAVEFRLKEAHIMYFLKFQLYYYQQFLMVEFCIHSCTLS